MFYFCDMIKYMQRKIYDALMSCHTKADDLLCCAIELLSIEGKIEENRECFCCSKS